MEHFHGLVQVVPTSVVELPHVLDAQGIHSVSEDHRFGISVQGKA